MNVRHDLLELTRFLTELSVIDYFFVAHRPSNVAAASLLYAMETIAGVPKSCTDEFVRALNKDTNLDTSSKEMAACSERIMLLYKQGDYAAPVSTTIEESPRDESHSPVCVSYGLPATAQVTPERSEFETYFESQ